MGTRHLIIVKVDNKVKLAQYGQWDGYLDGKGLEIAEFLQTYVREGYGRGKKAQLEEFKKNVRALKFVSAKRLEEIYAEIDKCPDDLVTTRFPAFSRDTSANILTLIAHGFISEVQNSIDFLKDGLFCEYAYTLDLDKEMVTVRTGHADGSTTIAFKVPFKAFDRFKVEKLHAELEAKREAEYQAAEEAPLQPAKKKVTRRKKKTA